MAKANVRAQIKDAGDAVREVMEEHLSTISKGMIQTIMARYKGLTPSTYMNAIKDVPRSGILDYKDALLTALSVVVSEAVDGARAEIPKSKKVKLSDNEPSIRLGEWDKLPPKLKKKALAMQRLIVETQMADLEKVVFWQYGSSVGSTDSLDLITQDMEISAEDFVKGNSVRAGANQISARLVNESRSAFFMDDKVAEEVEAFQFVNGDPKTDICTDLAGTIFAANDPGLDRYMPPLHWNCKSYIIPILKGKLGNREISVLKPSTKEIEDTIQFSESHRPHCASCGEPHDKPLDQ